jgi:hypothetical protein
VAHNFSDEVAVHIHDATEQEKATPDEALKASETGEILKLQVAENDRIEV